MAADPLAALSEGYCPCCVGRLLAMGPSGETLGPWLYCCPCLLYWRHYPTGWMTAVDVTVVSLVPRLDARNQTWWMINERYMSGSEGHRLVQQVVRAVERSRPTG